MWLARHQSFTSDVLIVYVVIVAVVGMHVAQACVWGAFYRYVVGIDSIRDSFYHSILALTTMDDGSGVLPDRWRMLGPAEGLTGWMVLPQSLLLSNSSRDRILRLPRNRPMAASTPASPAAS